MFTRYNKAMIRYVQIFITFFLFTACNLNEEEKIPVKDTSTNNDQLYKQERKKYLNQYNKIIEILSLKYNISYPITKNIITEYLKKSDFVYAYYYKHTLPDTNKISIESPLLKNEKEIFNYFNYDSLSLIKFGDSISTQNIINKQIVGQILFEFLLLKNLKDENNKLQDIVDHIDEIDYNIQDINSDLSNILDKINSN